MLSCTGSRMSVARLRFSSLGLILATFGTTAAQSYVRYNDTPLPEPNWTNASPRAVPFFLETMNSPISPFNSTFNSEPMMIRWGPSVWKSLENRAHAEALHEVATDRVGLLVDRGDRDRVFSGKDDSTGDLEGILISEGKHERLSGPKYESLRLRVVAEDQMSSGDFEGSIVSYQKALTILRTLADDKSQADVYGNVGWIFQSLGKVRDALDCYEAALALFQKLGDQNGEVRARLGIGAIFQSIGQFDDAISQYTRALPKASADQQARMLARVGAIYLSRNQPFE